MKHLIILLYFVSFTTGFSVLILGAFLWLKNKQKTLQYFIFTAFSLTLILLEQAITAYDMVNAIKSSPLDIILRYISTIGCSLMMYYLTKLVMNLSHIDMPNKYEWLLRVVSVMPLMAVTSYYINGNQIIISASGVLYFASILLNIIVLIGNLDKISSAILKAAIIKFIVISLLMLPILFLDTIVEKLPGIGAELPFGLLSVFLFYILFSGMSLYYMVKHYNTILVQMPENIVTPKDDGLAVVDNMTKNYDAGIDRDKILDQYNITSREKEIINLLIEGYSYNGISEKLMISLPTVKTHIQNIYKKLGIKNKMELIHFLSKND